MTAPELLHDRDAVLDYTSRLRPDVDRRDLEGALLALEAAGWIWPRIVNATHLMITRLETPRDLRNALRDPIQQRRTHLDRHGAAQ
jgi:hypothetical protein